MGERNGGRAAQRRRTEGRILEAARHLFSERGFEATTIRAVAAAAEVDPALVIHYFGSKEALFAQAISVTVEHADPSNPGEAIEHLLTSLNIKARGLPETTLAMMRSMLTHPTAGEAARDLLDGQIAAIGNTLSTDDARLRAALVMTTIVGVTIGRELIGVAALRRATPQQISDLLRPSLRALLIDDSESPCGGAEPEQRLRSATREHRS
jgi:AcrR family transcriptional regulator